MSRYSRSTTALFWVPITSDTLISMRVLGAAVLSGRGQGGEGLGRCWRNTIKQAEGVRLEANASSQLGVEPSVCSGNARCLVKPCAGLRPRTQRMRIARAMGTDSPDNWSRFSSMSLVGECLIGKAKYAEAEPLLIEGYNGLKQRETLDPC